MTMSGGLNSHPSAAMRQTTSAQPLWKAKMGIFYLFIYFQCSLGRTQFSMASSSALGSEETPGTTSVVVFFGMHSCVSTFCVFLTDEAFHLPRATTNCQLDFSVLSFLPALISYPRKTPSPVSSLKVTFSALAGAEASMPSS